MKAIISKPGTSNGYNYSRDKELVSAYSVIGKINGEMREIVTARCYMSRSSSASVVYCSLWVHAGNIYCSGKGSAGGYGYHKESAALQEAISSAGIELYGSPYRGATFDTPDAKRKAMKTMAHIGGCGSDSMREALEAIAKAAGARGKLVFISH